MNDNTDAAGGDAPLVTADIESVELDTTLQTRAPLSAAAFVLRDHLDIVDEATAAEALGVKQTTLWAWRRQGRAPDHVPIGQRIFYRRKDLADWIARQVVVQGGRN